MAVASQVFRIRLCIFQWNKLQPAIVFAHTANRCLTHKQLQGGDPAYQFVAHVSNSNNDYVHIFTQICPPRGMFLHSKCEKENTRRFQTSLISRSQ